MKIRYVKDTSFTKLKEHRLHFLSSNLKQKSDYLALKKNNKNGKIEEHWDAIQQIPKSSANANTMY